MRGEPQGEATGELVLDAPFDPNDTGPAQNNPMQGLLPDWVAEELQSQTFLTSAARELGGPEETASAEQAAMIISRLVEARGYPVQITPQEVMQILVDSSLTEVRGAKALADVMRDVLTIRTMQLKEQMMRGEELERETPPPGGAGMLWDGARELDVSSGRHCEVGGGVTGGPTELIESVKRDRKNLPALVAYLPEDVKSFLQSSDFIRECQRRFFELDKDGSGALDAAEVHPVVVELTQDRPVDVTIEHCVKFLEAFDLDGNGTISREEFVDFAQFVTAMACLEEQEAQTDAGDCAPPGGGPPKAGGPPGDGVKEDPNAWPLSAEAALTSAHRQTQMMHEEIAWLYAQLSAYGPPGAKLPAQAAGGGAAQPAQAAAPPSRSVSELMQDVRHLELDLEFYRQRAQQAADEKEELATRYRAAQKSLQETEQKIEEQEQRLRHQEIDLRAKTQELQSMQASYMGSMAPPGGILDGDEETGVEPGAGRTGANLSVGPGGTTSGFSVGSLSLSEGKKASMQEVLSALRTAHRELHKERRQREEVERKSLKLAERLRKVMGVVERQRERVNYLETKVKDTERLAEGRSRQLNEAAEAAGGLNRILRELAPGPGCVGVGFGAAPRPPPGGQLPPL